MKTEKQIREQIDEISNIAKELFRFNNTDDDDDDEFSANVASQLSNQIGALKWVLEE